MMSILLFHSWENGHKAERRRWDRWGFADRGTPKAAWATLNVPVCLLPSSFSRFFTLLLHERKVDRESWIQRASLYVGLVLTLLLWLLRLLGKQHIYAKEIILVMTHLECLNLEAIQRGRNECQKDIYIYIQWAILEGCKRIHLWDGFLWEWRGSSLFSVL